MKVKVEDVSSVKKVLHIEIPQDTVVSELDLAYRHLKKNAKVKGFRPGKAPRSVLERLYKKDVQADVLSRLIQTSFADAIKETDFKVVGSPQVDPPELDATSPYLYDAIIEVNPELADISIKGLELKRTKYKVGDDEIAIQLEVLQQNMTKKVKIEEDRPVQEGDFIVIDYEGFKDGKPYAETAKTENFTLKIGESTIAKDFDEQTIGMKAGESLEIVVNFPEDHFNDKLKNLSITFKITLHEIRKEEIPELDDAFAKSLGPFETLEDLKNMIKENLTQGYEKRIEQELNEQIFKALIETTEFEVPEVLVEYELESIITDTERRLSYQNQSMEEVGLTREGLREQYRETADKQVRRHLILSKVVEQEKLELADEELEEGYADMAKSLNQPTEQIKAFYDQNKERLDFFKHTLLEKKAIRLIIDNSNIMDVEPEKVAANGADGAAENEKKSAEPAEE
jgi:trigger factor